MARAGMATVMAMVVVRGPGAARAGLAYAWLPAHLLSEDFVAGRLKPLPLDVGAMRRMPLYVVLVKGEAAGPAARLALELFQCHRPV